MKKLKAFLVGEEDIVFAFSDVEALSVLNNHCGSDFKREDMDIEDLSGRLDIVIPDEEGNKMGTLGGFLEGCEHPQYFHHLE